VDPDHLIALPDGPDRHETVPARAPASRAAVGAIALAGMIMLAFKLGVVAQL
jgi:hypothetical protein